MPNTQETKLKWSPYNNSPEYRRLMQTLRPMPLLFKPWPRSLELILNTLPPLLLLSLLLVSEVQGGDDADAPVVNPATAEE